MKHRLMLIGIILLATIALLGFLLRGISYQWQLTRERVHFECPLLEQTAGLGCINTYYNTLVKAEGASTALRDVKKHYASFPRLRLYCHQVTHAIGRAATEGGATTSTLFGEGDPFCWSGYYHGVVEGQMRGVTSASITPFFVNDFCLGIPKTEANYFHYFNCVHGTGHAFMYISQNTLPTALKHCAEFREEDDRQNCAAGAFMENVNASDGEHTTSFIKQADPLFPCNSRTPIPLIEDEFQKTCYATQATYLWHQTKKDPTVAFAVCDTIADDTYHTACIEGIGREIVTTSQYNPKIAQRECALARAMADVDACIVGAVKNFVAFDRDEKKAEELCQILAPKERVVCKAVLDAYMKQFQKSESGT